MVLYDLLLIQVNINCLSVSHFTREDQFLNDYNPFWAFKIDGK